MNTVEVLKQRLICEYDSINQSKIMAGELSKTEYKHNKDIIHILYDNMTEYSVSYVKRTLELKTINL